VERQRGQIGGRQRLVVLLRRDPAQRAETIASRGRRRLARHVDPAGITDADALDAPRAIDQDADAPSQRVSGLRELARQLVGEDVVRRDAPPVKTLQTVLFGGREAEDVAV
jgi:hypothetical protein